MNSIPTVIENNTIVLKFDKIDDLPYISIITITRNRPFFYNLMNYNIDHLDYPSSRIEWIVIEDGTSRFEYTGHSELRFIYKHLGNLHFPIGYKRNMGAKLASYDLIMHMDDDDYYPPESILTRVRTLLKYRHIRCVGCLNVRTFNFFSETTMECHDPVVNFSESTLGYTKSFWNDKRFDNNAKVTEGHAFICDRLEQCMDIPSSFIIVQFDHHSNTIKRKSYNTVFYGTSFLNTIPVSTRQFLMSLRNEIVFQMPETQEVVSFIKSCKRSTKHKNILSRIMSLEPRLQRHPLIHEFRTRYPTKHYYKHKDIVFYYGSGKYMSFDRFWDFEHVSDIGGSEEAVLNLSRQFVLDGWSVCIYNERDSIDFQEGVLFKPFYHFNYNDKHNILIICRDPSNVSMRYNAQRVYLDLHDAIEKSWITEEVYSSIDAIMCKSNYHLSYIPEMYHDKCRVIPNGINTSIHVPLSVRENAFLCTSSPERCLSTLYRLYDDLSPLYPDFTIVHAYGFKGVRNSIHWKWIQKLVSSRERSRFVELENVSLNNITELYNKYKFFIYPTMFPEIDCVSLTKALASECTCIHTDVGALIEKEQFGTLCISQHDQTSELHEILPFYEDFKNQIIQCITTQQQQQKYNKNDIITTFDICHVSKKWYEIFETVF